MEGGLVPIAERVIRLTTDLKELQELIAAVPTPSLEHRQALVNLQTALDHASCFLGTTRTAIPRNGAERRGGGASVS